MKIMNVEATGNLVKIKKVSWKGVFVLGPLTWRLSPPAILQRCHPSQFAAPPSKRSETCRRFGWYGAGPVRRGTGLDGTRYRSRLHQ